jgi:hypothetical protein
MTPEKPVNSNAATKSPFALPAMADAYPLDPSERQAVDELLQQLERERTNGETNAAPADLESR